MRRVRPISGQSDDETGDVWQAALAGGWVIGGSNAWNPVGWTVLGIITVVSVVYGAKKLYKFAKSKRGKARPELKKQGRENISLCSKFNMR